MSNESKKKMDALFISAIIAIPLIMFVLIHATVVHIKEFYIMRESSQSLPEHTELIKELKKSTGGSTCGK